MTEIPLDEAEQIFTKSFDGLAIIGGFANHVSMVLSGTPTDIQGELASMVHAKMCAHARSIGAVAQSSMFDHSAIMALARMMIEGMTMSSYIRELVSAEEWELRYAVLSLHDTVARIKLFRAWKEKAEYADLRIGRDALLQGIRTNSVFLELGVDVQERLLRGEDLFVGGMRKAAMRAGWNEDSFTALYGYLSTHVHSAPMSFFRARVQQIDYYRPGQAQHAAASMAIEIASACHRRVTLLQLDDHLRKFPDDERHFHAELVQEVRNDDTKCSIFKRGG